MEDFDANVSASTNGNAPVPDVDLDATIPSRKKRRSLGEFVVGDTIARRYQVVSMLGRGAMGVVYRCFDQMTSVEVALKGLPPELAGSDWEMEEIKRNFQLVHNLRHPNIAGYNTLDFDYTSGSWFLVMEYVEGVELRRYLKNNHPDHNTIINILKQLADALDYAHSQEILHRDIKPGNIIIDKNGNVKLLDFGLAAQIHSSMSKVSMQQNSCGTAPYMSPEQWRGRRQKSASDQYALGVVAYEMFTGFLPFENSDPAVLQQVVLTQEPEAMENVAYPIQCAIFKAMSKKPEDRFASCSAFIQALTAPVATPAVVPVNRVIPATPQMVATVAPIVPVRKFPTVKIIVTVLVLLLLAGAGVGIWLFYSSNGKKSRVSYSSYSTAASKAEVEKTEDETSEVETTEAEKLYLRKAESGDAEAQYQLGYCYLNGTNCAEKNYEKAVYWYRKAAEQNHVWAQFRLGYCYRNGFGVEKDVDQAFYWYKKSAENGNMYGQYILGLFYENGNGVTKNLDEAEKWYKKASDQGDSDAKTALERVRKAKEEANMTEAEKLYLRKAESGDAEAQYLLGYCYLNGTKGAGKNYKKAVYWYRKAAEQNHAGAQCDLGYCYDDGCGVEEDVDQAFYWYKKSAQNGNMAAQHNLGWCYEKGEGCFQDYEQAVYWYRKAAAQGNENAQIALRRLGY